jgi:crotonobetainyl-CoA:carnitine CoA-transferase CaiB-like acyl-CoA transferase
MTGEADGPPMLPSIPLGDTLTAIAGTVGALAACYHRDARGGAGQHVDVSMYEPILTLMAGTILAADPASPETMPHRTGSRVPNGVPRNVYRTRDGHWVVVSGTTDNQVARLLPLLGLDTEEGRARYGKAVDRVRHADELDARVAEWVAARDRADVMALLLAERIPVAPVNSVSDLLTDPHLAARGDLVRVSDAVLGELTMVTPNPRLSATPGRIRWPGPALGAHNDEVYAEWIGLGDAELTSLREAHVI